MTVQAEQLPLPVRESRQHSLCQSVALHLLPGIPSLVAFTVIAAVLRSRDLPNVFALYLVILLVEVPVLLGLLIYLGRREEGRVNWRRLLPYRARLPLWQYALLGLPLIIWSVVMQGVITPAIQAPLLETVFVWAPDWFVLDFAPELFGQLSRPALLTLWVLGFVSPATIGGLMQELYFRGYLLPRMAWMGWWAPVLNAALFALFHLTSLWSVPGFFLMILPWSLVVFWKKSLLLGVIAHSGMLLLSWLGMTAVIFGGVG